jgi:hypothetical protein
VFRMELSRGTRSTLLAIAGAFVTYGILLTVIPTLRTPFGAKFTLPKMGWQGVYGFAIAFDVIAAVLAFFVLRKMKVPALVSAPGESSEAATAPLSERARGAASAGR